MLEYNMIQFHDAVEFVCQNVDQYLIYIQHISQSRSARKIYYPSGVFSGFTPQTEFPNETERCSRNFSNNN